MTEIALTLVSLALIACISLMAYRNNDESNRREHQRLVDDWNKRDQTMYGLQVKLFEGGTVFIETPCGIKDSGSIFNNVYYYQKKDLDQYDSRKKYKDYKVCKSKDLAYEKLEHIHRTQSDIQTHNKVYMRSNIITIDVEAKESNQKVA